MPNLKSTLIILTTFLFGLNLAYASSRHILVISDIHLNATKQTKMVIDPDSFSKMNDMDRATFNKLTRLISKNIHIEKVIPKPNLILYLGDLTQHKQALTSQAEHSQIVKNDEEVIFKRLLKTFPNTPIFYVFGNNDSLVKDYGEFTSPNHNSPYRVAMQSGFKNGFLSTGHICRKPQPSPCILQEDPQFGFYSARLAPKLILIALNSVMFSTKHNANTTDTDYQFSFLTKTLQAAERNRLSVLIAMHIPAGNNIYDGSAFWKPEYKNKFLAILEKYHSQIRGLLVGHTHMEEFKVLQFKNGNIGQYFTAALSTNHGNSPSVKSFLLKETDGKWFIKNYETFGIHGDFNDLKLSKSYNFADTYCLDKYATEDINQCLQFTKPQNLRQHITVDNPNYKDYPIKSPQSFYLNADVEK